MPMRPSARLYFCLRCNTQVVICSRCDRGQRYCPGDCANEARRASSRRASRHYQRTRQGRLNNARRQQRFRDKAHQTPVSDCDPIRRVGAKVTHQGSPERKPPVSYPRRHRLMKQRDGRRVATDEVRCDVCAGCCDAFLRRDFVHTTTRAPPG